MPEKLVGQPSKYLPQANEVPSKMFEYGQTYWLSDCAIGSQHSSLVQQFLPLIRLQWMHDHMTVHQLELPHEAQMIGGPPPGQDPLRELVPPILGLAWRDQTSKLDTNRDF